MANSYLLLAPRAPLASANQATPECLHTHTPHAVRSAVNGALHGVEWDAGAIGVLLRGNYDGPGGWLELSLPTHNPEFLHLRAAPGRATERLVQQLCDRTGWTALDLQTLVLLSPRPLPDLARVLTAPPPAKPRARPKGRRPRAA